MRIIPDIDVDEITEKITHITITERTTNRRQPNSQRQQWLDPAAATATGSANTNTSGPRHVPANRANRYYTVARTKRDYEDLLGIHVCAWQQLEDRLPNKKLLDSGCYIKGFSTWDDAKQHWFAEGHTKQPMRHTYN
jgi:hypothetical protein